jgi:hypothetical protein
VRPATARHDRVAYFLHGADTAALEMRIVKLIKRAVDAIAGDASRLITYDADLTGFGLRRKTDVPARQDRKHPHGE